MVIKLTQEQQLAADKISDWWFNSNKMEKQIFTLAGYAGVGKSFLLAHVLKDTILLKSDEVGYVTPTGKAACVLTQRGCDACTIHRLIYAKTEKEYISVDENGKERIKYQVEFIRKESITELSLIIIDEFSMVSLDILEDIMSYNIPIIATGDPGQLPPVKARRHGLLEKADAVLTQIMRQAEDSQILKLATMARNKEHIPYGTYGKDVMVIPKSRLTESNFKNILMGADQILCGKNSTRHAINKMMREYYEYNEPYPYNGEKVICTINNYELYLDENEKYSVTNGTIGYVKSFNAVNLNDDIGALEIQADFLPEDQVSDRIYIDTGYFTHAKNEYRYDKHQPIFIFENRVPEPKLRLEAKRPDENDKEYKAKVAKMFRNIKSCDGEMILNQVEFGYAISVHKSQGSEFDFVIVFDESGSFGDDAHKWLYTAITRAKQKLIIVR